ncbi:hypothetical protein GQ600_6244 [Phytophthora cactorum]|nr:hypothetical protein GQ600_6244 [Phytophthora cactorum]
MKSPSSSGARDTNQHEYRVESAYFSLPALLVIRYAQDFQKLIPQFPYGDNIDIDFPRESTYGFEKARYGCGYSRHHRGWPTSAGVPVAVYHDATYSLSESCGIPCSGVGTGDVATADCQPYLLSYNGAVCVAPVDAECVLGHDDVWHCEFPKTGYTSAVEAETIAGYDGESSGWGAGHDEGVHVGDEAEDTLLESTTTLPSINHWVSSVTWRRRQRLKGTRPKVASTYGSTGNTKSTTGGKTNGIDATPHVDLTGTTETTEGGTTSEGGTTTGGYTTESTTHGNTEEGTEGQHATVNYEGAYEESGNTVDNENYFRER